MSKTKRKEDQPALFADATPPLPKTVAEKKKVPARPARAVAVAQPAKIASLPAPPNMLAIIAQAASNPLIDVSKMKELLAMQREIEQSEQSREFNRALLAAQNEIPKIVKDRSNEHTKSRYATLERVSKDVDPIARKHGFTMSFGTADSPIKDHYRIVCDLSHEGGHTRRYLCDLQADTAGSQGKSNKTPIQGVGSTMSYARRYLKVMMFDLTIVGEDTDGNKRKASEPVQQSAVEGEIVPLITATQRATLVKAIEDCGVGLQKFCDHYVIKAVGDLAAELYTDAMQACKNYNEKKEERRGGKGQG